MVFGYIPDYNENKIKDLLLQAFSLLLLPRRLDGRFITSVLNKLPKSSALLDVGCGDLIISLELAKKGYENVIGIDISKEAIYAATET